MSVYQTSIIAFIKMLESQTNLIPLQDWTELQQLSSNLPENDNEEISEILETWLKLESRSQLLATYKQNLKSLTATSPVDPGINIGIGNSKSQTPPDKPSPSSKELLDNAIKHNSPLSNRPQPQP
ncbi:hypothetical protein HCG51_20065 [Tolypothrix sp. PCC 7910]|uniref:hypothetical protein n=1 Tax=Tolypothrix sp. PCC 7910 TaxID=2099387 RepID=UPI001427761C|nr:hypothetical protein [Tolypothrix sp. PCC 7910]QIR38769.1 hypothetical protein HCG51_20065 [Tolypothrix sp. PCC 7910]